MKPHVNQSRVVKTVTITQLLRVVAVAVVSFIALAGCDAAAVMQIVPGISPSDAATVAARFNPHPHHMDPFLVCVRSKEGGYTEPNHSKPPSSASGAYQFIKATWDHQSAAAGHPGYARAMYAPPWVQDDVAWYTISHGGWSNWHGDRCGHGT